MSHTDEFDGRHPGTLGLLRWFDFDHLPAYLRAVSQPCGQLAAVMVRTLPDGPELTAGLRKLLEAKDCFVRQAVPTAQETRPAKRSAPQPECGSHGRESTEADVAGR